MTRIPTGVSLPSGLPIRSPRTIAGLRCAEPACRPLARPTLEGNCGPLRRGGARARSFWQPRSCARGGRGGWPTRPNRARCGGQSARAFFFVVRPRAEGGVMSHPLPCAPAVYDNVQVDAAGYYVLSAPRREATRATRGRPLLRRQAPPPIGHAICAITARCVCRLFAYMCRLLHTFASYVEITSARLTH